MFNPEKLLGGMLRGGSRRRGGLGGLVSGGAALGMLGVAMEAVEHFMNKPQTGTRGRATPPPAPPSGTIPGPPPMSTGPSVPPPSQAGPASPPPMQGVSIPAQPAAAGESNDAVLLIRAMIAAAAADGVIDEKERNRILEKLNSVTLSPEEHSFIVHELLAPKDLDTIVGQVHTPELARQVYAVSLLSIEVDTDAEREYMNRLIECLELDEATVDSVHRDLGINRY